MRTFDVAMMAKTNKARSIVKLYWVTTDDHDEDWFILATTGRQGRYPLAAHVPFTCRLQYLPCTMIVKIAYHCSASC